jgi:hypothetical protein
MNNQEGSNTLGKNSSLDKIHRKVGSVCLPIFKTLKKIRKSEWDEDCNMAFLNLKEYLSNPPVMSRLIV